MRKIIVVSFVFILLMALTLSSACIGLTPDFRVVDDEVVVGCYGDLIPCVGVPHNLGSIIVPWDTLYVGNIVGWTPAGTHAQNTDWILTYDGINALIDSGLVVHDIETDRWLLDTRNTFFGIGVAGAGNLAHTAGNEGYYNTAFGCDAASSITTGYRNTVMGSDAAESITTGHFNTVVGSSAAQSITTGEANTAVGANAESNITDGNNNTAIGYGALDDVTTGDGNTVVGRLALASLVTGSYNTVVGTDAMFEGTGSFNTAIGLFAGHENTGDRNIFIGNSAGYDEAGSDKLYIDNTNDATPLIYGDFSTDTVVINDNLEVADELTLAGETIKPPAYGELYITTPIVTEMTTAGLYYMIAGTTTSEEMLHFANNGLGRLTYTGAEDNRVFIVTASLSSWLPAVDCPAILAYRIYVNGVGDIASSIADVISAGDSLDAMQMVSLITLDSGDYIEIYVVSNINNCSLNVITMSLGISNVD